MMQKSICARSISAVACLLLSILFSSNFLFAQTPQCGNGVDDDNDGGTDALVYVTPDNNATRTLSNADPFALRSFQRQKAAELGLTQIKDVDPSSGAVLFDQTTALFLCNLAGYSRVAQMDSYYPGSGRHGYASPHNNTLGRWNPALNDFQILNAASAGNRWIATLVCAGKMPACSDGVDNDKDGQVDFPGDNGCDSANDDSELIHDPDCDSPTDPSEQGDAECSDGVDNDGDGQTDYLNDIGFTSGQETFGLVNGGGNPGHLVNLVRAAIQSKNLPYSLPQGAFTRKLNSTGGGNRWNDNGTLDTATVTKVCEILGYRTYVSSTMLDSERSGRYPNGKANYHSPHNNHHTRWINGNFVVQSAEPKYKKNWLATVTCKDPLPACSDGKDNDGDGKADGQDSGCANGNDNDERPHDTNCTGPDDDNESPDTQCNDGTDNDGDGKVDWPEDPGCSGPTDTNERTGKQCDDGADNDGDGKIDFPADNGCTSVHDDDERSGAACDDGIDNDGDGKVDFPADPGCSSKDDNDERTGKQCDDGADNDGDGKIDFPADDGCTGINDDDERKGTACDDGIDNDGDGKVDFPADPGCSSKDDTDERTGKQCDDGTDNDGDGKVDFPADDGCTGINDDDERKGTACDDGIDNDGDGKVDFPADPGCSSKDDTSERDPNGPACDNGKDDDNDSMVDFPNDPGCTGPTDTDESNCVPGTKEARSCSTGEVGVCEYGTQTRTCGANFQFSEWGACEQNTTASAEVCGDGSDNDCDGQTDNADTDCFQCQPGAKDVADCSTGAAGVCAAGQKTRDCVAGFWTAYGACEGDVEPGSVAEVCDDGKDNDCDGQTDAADSDCYECEPGETEDTACSSGAGGVCESGWKGRTCGNDGTWSAYGECEPEIAPGSQAEICDDTLDNDCDGDVDAEDLDCDQCPDDPDKNAPGQCGCGLPESTITKYALQWQNPGNSNLGGIPTFYDLSFTPETQTLRWVATYRPNPQGLIPEGFQFAVNAGGNPKGHDGELAFFFFDGKDAANPKLTVYGYNSLGVEASGASAAGTQSSWKDGSKVAGIQPPDKILSSVADDSFVKEFIVTNNADGTRTLGFVIDATAINKHEPLYPDTDGQPWQGAQFSSVLGLWFHGTAGLTASYGADGYLTNWQYQALSFTDTNELATVQTLSCGECEAGDEESQNCDSGEPGVCAAGEQLRVCSAQNSWGAYGTCSAVIAPGSQAEICNDGFDNDCDGDTDASDADCFECQPGATESVECSTGQQGVCAGGQKSRTCSQSGVWSEYGSCQQTATSSTEVCTDSIDNDCDGQTDNADTDCFQCQPGAKDVADCSTGATGICDAGQKTRDCVAGFWTEYGACEGDVEPGSVAEVCDDGFDNDCDGQTDATDTDCFECEPGSTESEACATGNTGVCEAGSKTRTCEDGYWSAYGACEGEVAPGTVAEVCDDTLDNDCDGDVDAEDLDCDQCPDDPDKTAPGQCGCGLPELTFTTNAIAWVNPPNAGLAGIPTLYDLSFSPETQTLRWVATFRPNAQGTLPDGFQFAANAGNNPKGHDGELAFFYFDAQDKQNPKLTVYGYNSFTVTWDPAPFSGTQTSWQDGSNQPGIQPPDKILSSVADDSFVKEFIVTDNADGTRTIGFVIDATAINKHEPLYPDTAGQPWQGIAFDSVVGLWFHTLSDITATYGPDGFLTNWHFGKLSSTDTNELATVQTLSCGECEAGDEESQNCDSGEPGVCAAGEQVRVCSAQNSWGAYGACSAVIAPGSQAEVCDDGFDNDCDGDTDTADADCFECQPGETESESCGTGATGACAAGERTRTCGQDGNWGEYGSCEQLIEAGTVAEVCDDNIDNDCDGDTDKDDVDCYECQSGDWEERACDSELVGLCAGGKQDRTCTDTGTWNEWSECSPIVVPGEQAEDCFDEKDNDCNGLTDREDPACFECEPEETETWECDTGEKGVCGVGEKTRVCGADHFWGSFGGCQTVTEPGAVAEVCGDGADNDCDGTTDADDTDCWECQPGDVEEKECESGLHGVCGGGKSMRMCNSNGTWKDWSRCVPLIAVGAQAEQCGDSQDNDCDGKVDASDSDCFECQPGDTEDAECSSGAAGICAAGLKDRTCGDDGKWSEYGACEPEIAPGSEGEVCDDGKDNDCDGKTDAADDDCWECQPGAEESANCNSSGAGVCEPGAKVRTCDADGTWSDFGACESKIEAGSQEEICDDGLDNDCDGQKDSHDSDCYECEPGELDEASCETDEPGLCEAGTRARTCGETGQWGEYGACESDVEPGSEGEICDDGIDNDCDGQTDSEDDDCWTCTPGETDSASCNTGEAGACNAGEKTRTCGADGQWGGFGSCEQSTTPGAENCSDGIDNDCDGATDADDADCVECSETNNTSAIQILDGNSKSLGRRIESLAREYRRKAKNKADKRWGLAAQRDGVRLGLDGWALAWKLPQVTLSCSLSSQCASASITADKLNYLAIIDKLKSYRNELELRTKKTNKKGRLGKYVKTKLAEFDALYAEAVEGLGEIPESTDSCD